MIDSPKMLYLLVFQYSKKIDGSRITGGGCSVFSSRSKTTNFEIVIIDQKITHIIINNYKIDNDVEYDYLPEDIECEHISLDIIVYMFTSRSDHRTIIKSHFFINLRFQLSKLLAPDYAESHDTRKQEISWTHDERVGHRL